MQLDLSRYLHHLDCIEMEPADKMVFLEQLRVILDSFVDRAFGDAPEQIMLGIRRARAARIAASGIADPLGSDRISSTFNDAAG